MQLSKVISIFSLAAASSAVSVSYDVGYDDSSRSLTKVACSDGDNGLITRFGWKTQGEIPKFPYIGGGYAVGGYNSPNCGSCWSVSYGGKTIHVLAIDSASRGLNIGLRAMNDLTNNRAVELGRVEANVQPVNPSACGL
ncbi:hypothetical protein VTI28DRAFT_5276 [Corynascus sepedonium]